MRLKSNPQSLRKADLKMPSSTKKRGRAAVESDSEEEAAAMAEAEAHYGSGSSSRDSSDGGDDDSSSGGEEDAAFRIAVEAYKEGQLRKLKKRKVAKKAAARDSVAAQLEKQCEDRAAARAAECASMQAHMREKISELASRSKSLAALHKRCKARLATSVAKMNTEHDEYIAAKRALYVDVEHSSAAIVDEVQRAAEAAKVAVAKAMREEASALRKTPLARLATVMESTIGLRGRAGGRRVAAS